MGVTVLASGGDVGRLDDLRFARIRVVQRIDGSADKTQCRRGLQRSQLSRSPARFLRGGGVPSRY